MKMTMKTSCDISLLKMMLSAAFLFFFFAASAQQDNQGKAAREAERYMEEAEDALAEEDFATAEAYYRRAIAKDPSNATAKYNMGNLYFNEEKPEDPAKRHSEATEMATDKTLKHKAFHNKGNALMRQKDYKAAIEAYKDALRNDPDDDETRYNLALAKEKWEQQQESGGGENNKDQQGENQDKESENKDQQGEQGEQEPEDQGDQKDKGEEGDQKNEDQKDSEGEKDDQGEPQNEQQQNEGNKPKDKGQPQQQQPVPGQLSPQQIKSLLEAMSNEEKQVQDKINAEKAKGVKTTTEKDW